MYYQNYSALVYQSLIGDARLDGYVTLILAVSLSMSRLLVTQYQSEVEKIIRYGGSKKETSIRNAFDRLLNDYCKPRNYLLVPELDFKTKFNK